MRLFLALLLVFLLQTANASARENSISEFLTDFSKDVDAVFSGHMDDRKTLTETVGETCQYLLFN